MNNTLVDDTSWNRPWPLLTITFYNHKAIKASIFYEDRWLDHKSESFFMALVSLKFMDLDVYMWKKKLSLAKGQKGISKFEVSMKSTTVYSHEQKLFFFNFVKNKTESLHFIYGHFRSFLVIVLPSESLILYICNL